MTKKVAEANRFIILINQLLAVVSAIVYTPYLSRLWSNRYTTASVRYIVLVLVVYKILTHPQINWEPQRNTSKTLIVVRMLCSNSEMTPYVEFVNFS